MRIFLPGSALFAAGPAIAVAAALIAAPAFAADMAVKARPIADPTYEWSGFYIGAGIGWQRDETRWETTAIGNPPLTPALRGRLGLGGPIATFNADQFRLAGYAGYNVQVSRVVFGIEGDIATGFDNKKSLNYIRALYPVLRAATRRWVT